MCGGRDGSLRLRGNAAERNTEPAGITSTHEGALMASRRIVGVDLGVATAHTVVVCDETGATLTRRRCRSTRSSLEALEAAALDDAAEGTRLEVVMEPTGAAWQPVAVFFARRDHVVYPVSSAK